MSHPLISLNPDLSRLVNEGYEAHIRGGNFLLISGIPYYNAQKEIRIGTLVTHLELSGQKTIRPDDHKAHFIGSHPCDRNGNLLTTIQHATNRTELAKGIVIECTFSNKPRNRKYHDYYEKMNSYARIISDQVTSEHPEYDPHTYRHVASQDSASVFHYVDTNTTRAEIAMHSERLKNHRVAIVGLGGTGSYLLDLLAKTPLAEIHLFDGDTFQSHNAFRAPGAPTLAELDAQPVKVEYFTRIYSRMHRYVVPHPEMVTGANLTQLDSMNFVFVAIDRGEARKLIFDHLTARGIPFIDVGMFLRLRPGGLGGHVRTTLLHAGKNDHAARHVPFADAADNEYRANIQIADLNMLNAALAVVRWKKHLGFYDDREKEHQAAYNTVDNEFYNEEKIA